jgi:hypothetical protein
MKMSGVAAAQLLAKLKAAIGRTHITGHTFKVKLIDVHL